MKRSRVQSAIYVLAFVLLAASSVAGGLLTAYFVSLRFSDFDAQWELPFPFVGIPAVLMAFTATMLFAIGGLRQNQKLVLLSLLAAAVPVVLTMLVWFNIYPHGPSQPCCK